MTVQRVSADDLAAAHTWLLAYEPDDADGETLGDHEDTADEHAQTLLRVARWIAAEIERREVDAAARAIRASVEGATLGQAKAAIRKVRAERVAAAR